MKTSKKRRQDFTQKHKMPFKKLMWLMLSLVKESSQNVLERYFPKIKEAVHMSPAGIQPCAAKSEREP
jgi:hypothetical protein